MKFLVFFLMFVPTSVFAQAMSLQQAINRSIKDRVESAENFQKNYISTKTDADLAAQLVEGGAQEKKRSVSSDKGSRSEGLDLESDDDFGMELDE